MQCNNSDLELSSEHWLITTVDLDGTPFGYVAGEVETVTYSEDKIANAKQRISKLLLMLGSYDESENV
eukprot:12342390-Ditylum_brightwellii.AAC.1